MTIEGSPRKCDWLAIVSKTLAIAATAQARGEPKYRRFPAVRRQSGELPAATHNTVSRRASRDADVESWPPTWRERGQDCGNAIWHGPNRGSARIYSFQCAYRGRTTPAVRAIFQG